MERRCLISASVTAQPHLAGPREPWLCPTETRGGSAREAHSGLFSCGSLRLYARPG